MTSKNSTVAIGQATETIACQYLTQQGLKLITTNFHSRTGELDLIMKENDVWVFIEVKYRKNTGFGGALASITVNKQKKIRQCATYYLQQAGINEYNTPCRFDVVTIEGNINNPEITWLTDAF